MNPITQYINKNHLVGIKLLVFLPSDLIDMVNKLQHLIQGNKSGSGSPQVDQEIAADFARLSEYVCLE